MADFNFTQQPNDVDQAYGPVIATTYDNDEDGLVNAVRIRRQTDDSTVAVLRQSPNAVGYAHFDISKILQKQISYNPNLELTTLLAGSSNEALEYYLQAGYIDSNGDFQFQETTSYKTILYGRKTFTEVDYDSSPYRPQMVTISGTQNSFTQRGRPLTDKTYDVTDAADLPGTVPTIVSSDVYRFSRRPDEQFTISWMNRWEGSPLSSFNGIKGFQCDLYDAAGASLGTVNVNNVTGNGGGPNTSLTDEDIVRAPFTMISIQAGVLNSSFDVAGLAYMYIVPWAYFKDPAVDPSSRIYPWNACRIDIDNGECNDFDPIQVSWVNSFGVKDYFTFQKRNDKRVNITRNEYNKTFPDWSEATYAPTVNFRGRATFNTAIQETYTANTRYLTDGESSYLQNLYVSPEVKVRFEGSNDWLPVVLTDNTYTERTFRKDKLFQHTINFKLANNQQIQNG